MKHIFTEGPIDEVDLQNRALLVLKEKGLHQLDMNAIQQIHKEHGADIASMAIRECIKLDPEEQAFQHALRSALPKTNMQLHLVVIPTMYYMEHPELGGAGEIFQMIARRLRIKVSVVPVKSLGSIKENAKIVAKFIEGISENDNVWLLAMSKGTADTKHALLNYLGDKAKRKIKGFINISGMPGGTPLTGKGKGISVGYHVMKHWLRFRGGDASMVEEMFTEHPLSKAHFELPNHIQVINIIGVPIISYLRKPVCSPYLALAKDGPNDGCVLLKDAIIPTGNTIALWGVDHYMRDPQVAKWAERILNWVTIQDYA